MNMHILMLVGLIAATVVMPVLAQHAKQLARWRPQSRKGSPWPVVVDLACIGWVAVLRAEGLLTREVETPEGVTLGWGSVVLLGLVLGAIYTLGYDQFMTRRQPAKPTT